MPPMVARLLVDNSGAKNRPWGLSAAFNWSLTTPPCTRTQRSSVLISRIRFMCLEQSTIRPSVNDWPLVPVPPPRGLRPMRWKRGSDDSRAISIRSSVLAG
ncbi:hypothetical protein D9M70_548570 [compost metagenome]